jgi:hypothetical protein
MKRAAFAVAINQMSRQYVSSAPSSHRLGSSPCRQ